MATDSKPKAESNNAQVAAPQPANQSEAPAGRLPKELRPWQVAFTYACMPVFLSMFTCAILGLYVIQDKEQTSWLSHTWFGEQWRMAVAWNQFINSGMLNGGLLGSVIASVRLKEHRAARRDRLFRSQFKIYKPEDLVQDKRSKRKSEPKKRR